MCSVNDEVVLCPSPPSLNLDQVCMKCRREKAVTIARTKDPFCRTCFDHYFTHRFRATFGKARLIRQGEEVLLAFSGGQSSRVLLHLVEEGLSEHAVKRLRFIPIIIYIDEGVVFGHDSERRRVILKEVAGIVSQNPFPGYFTRLEEVFTGSRVWTIDDPVSLPGSDEHSKLITHSEPSHGVENEGFECPIIDEGSGGRRLKELFDSLQSSTAKEDMLQSLRRQLLVDIASKHFNVNKILVADNATRLSVRLLGNIAQGRGSTIPLDTGFCDDRAGVMVLRPLREFPESEISSYFTLHQLQSVSAPSNNHSLLSGGTSIEGLTSSFVASLQSNFTSTVSTIFRTSDKLQLSEELVGSGQCCPLCQAPCGRMFNEELFCHVSATGMDKNLCYGCRLTVSGMKGKEKVLGKLFSND